MANKRATPSGFKRITGLNGQHVVFTGHFDPHRHMVQHIAEEAGATVKDHVTADTTLLVLGRPSALYKHSGYGTKIAAARSIIPKTFIAEISDSTFRRLANGETVNVLTRQNDTLSSFGVPAAIGKPPRRRSSSVTATVLGDNFDRATREHHDALAAIADSIYRRGLVPLTPGTGMPLYDLAVDTGKLKYVIEVKSIVPGENETEQVRLGVGQVLHYIGIMATGSGIPPKSFAPIVATSQPASNEIVAAYKQHGIVICHPGNIHRFIKK